MEDPSSLNEWILHHGDEVLPFYTSCLVDGGLSRLPVYLMGWAYTLEVIGSSSWAELSR